jgi:hypothetical protein
MVADHSQHGEERQHLDQVQGDCLGRHPAGNCPPPQQIPFHDDLDLGHHFLCLAGRHALQRLE